MEITLYTILYTINDGRDLKKNDYIWIYYTWLWNLIKHKALENTDNLVVFIDIDTLNFIKDTFIHKTLTGHFHHNFKMDYCIIPRPETLLGGFFNKYHDTNFEFLIGLSDTPLSQRLFYYCDIDNIIKAPIRSFFTSIHQNTIYLQIEGLLKSDAYLGTYIASDEHIDMLSTMKTVLNDKSAGFTAGMFAFCFKNKQDILTFFKILNDDRNRQSGMEKYFEQNSFNFTVYFHRITNTNFNIDVSIFNTTSTVSINNILMETPIISFMGDAGNETAHLEKIFCYLFWNK